MKKRIILPGVILLITMILFTFVACSNSNKEENNDNNEVTTGTNQETNTSEQNETDVFFNYSEGISDTGLWKDVKALNYVNLCEYKKISVPGEVHGISDESVMAEVDSILSQYATQEEITDRAIVDGDTVNIDFVGSIDGKEFEGGNTGGVGTDVTIGVTNYIDDFLEQLIGHKPGESFDIEVTFPEDYGKEDLNGKDAVFAITVNYIVKTVAPELNDEFVKSNLSTEYGWDNVQNMKEAIRNDLRRIALENYVKDYVVKNSKVTSVPDNMIEYQENSLVGYFKEYAQYYNMKYDDFLKNFLGVATSEDLLKEYREDNVQMATLFLVIQAVAEDSKITVNEDDIAKYFMEYEGSSDYSVYQEIYGLPYLKLLVLNQEVIKHLVDNTVLS